MQIIPPSTPLIIGEQDLLHVHTEVASHRR